MGEKRTNPFALLIDGSLPDSKKQASSFGQEVDDLMLHITTDSHAHNSPQSVGADMADREQRRKLKKLRKKAVKIQEQLVYITPNLDHLRSKRNSVIKIKDWINLAQHMLRIPGIGHPNWASISNLNSVNQVVILYIPQLSSEFVRFSENIESEKLPVLERFQHVILTCGPAEKTRLQSAQQEMLNVPLSHEQRKESRSSSQNYGSYAEMTLTPNELEENLYPLSLEAIAKDLSAGQTKLVTIEDLCSEWVSTVDASSANGDGFVMVNKDKNSIYALDCEMCITKIGLEVVRVTLVDFHRKVVYDKFLLPENPIIDYNTKFSGITKEHMEGVTLTLGDVQKHLLALIAHDTILIGHSLENDLKRLRIIHRRVIDTAVLYHSSKGPPSKPSLRYLSQQYLEKVIQSGDEGHDSAVDAITCLELVQLKLKMGKSFGHSTNECECLLERFSRNNIECGIVNCHGYEKFSGTWDAVKARKFVFYKLKQLDHSRDDDGPSVASMPDALASLNREITDVLDGVPKNTVVIALSGHGDTKAASGLLTKRREYHQLINRFGASVVHDTMASKVFGPENMASLEQEIRTAKIGLGMVWVKHY